MGSMEKELAEQNSGFFAVYTNDGENASVTTAFNRIKSHMNTIALTGEMPPIEIPYLPFVAVIDMKTGKVIARDKTVNSYLKPSDVLHVVTVANID